MAKSKTPKDWSLESRQLAIKKGYLRGKLKGSAIPDVAPTLPARYPKSAKTVAERRAALAGYRLADEIRNCLASVAHHEGAAVKFGLETPANKIVPPAIRPSASQ